MIKKHNVRCGIENKPAELAICTDTVYKRYNIHTITTDEGIEEYEYDEDQLSLIEYFKQVVPDEEQSLGELSILFSQYQAEMDKTLAEISILLGEVATNV